MSGALESGSENVLIVVQGRTSQQAVITSLSPRILTRQPIPNGVVVAGCQTPAKGALPTNDLKFSLDQPGTAFQGAFSVSSNDSDMFNLYATSQHYAYTWVAEMKVVQNDHVFTIDIPASNGQPFATTPQGLAAQYSVDEDTGSWWVGQYVGGSSLPGPPSNK